MVNHLANHDGLRQDPYNLTSNLNLNSVQPYLIVYCLCLFFTIITGIIVNIIVIAAYKYGYNKNTQRSNSILVNNKSRNLLLKKNHAGCYFSPHNSYAAKKNIDRRVSLAVTTLQSNYKHSKLNKFSDLTLDEAKTNFNHTSKLMKYRCLDFNISSQK